MNRKGIQSNVLILLIVGVVVIVGSIVFFNALFRSIGDCNFQSVAFLGNLPKRIESMVLPSSFGSSDSASFRIPCGEQAYFLDKKKRAELISSKAFDDVPVLKDAVESGTEDNFFIMNQDKIAFSYPIEGVELDYPYHLCFDATKQRKVNMLLTGRGKEGVGLTPYCSQVECTSVPEILSSAEIENLLLEVCEGDASCITKERFNIQNAQNSLDVKLRVSACYPKATKIEFLITPKEGTAAKGVKFFETVPKDCMDDLRKLLTFVDGGDTDVIVKPDPMLVWDFDSVREERQVAYHISKMLDDRCRKQLKAVASAELIVKDEFEDVPIDEVTKDMLDSDFVASLQSRGITVPRGNMNSIRQEHPLRFDESGLISGWYAIDQGNVDASDWGATGGNTAPSIDFGKFNAQDKIQILRFDTQDIFGKKVWEFASDTEQQSQNLKFSLSKTGGSGSINCNLLFNPNPREGDIDCNVAGTSDERATFSVTVEDAGSMMDSDIFEVVIQ